MPIEIENIDELRDTRITLGCYRDVARLGRMLRVFLKSLTVARAAGDDKDLLHALKDLHDHKGTLTATWVDDVFEMSNAVNPDVPVVFLYVEAAWADENEILIKHVVRGVEYEREVELPEQKN